MNSSEHDATATARYCYGIVHRFVFCRAIERNIYAALSSVRQNVADDIRFPRIEDNIGSHEAAHLATFSHRFDGPDPSRTYCPNGRDGEQPDGPCAEDRNGLSQLHRRELEGMQHDRKRLKECRDIEVEPQRHRKHIGCRKIDELAKEAGVGRSAEESDVRTEIMLAAAAILAMVAVHCGFEDSQIPRRPACDAVTGTDNLAGGLVSQYGWESRL